MAQPHPCCHLQNRKNLFIQSINTGYVNRIHKVSAAHFAKKCRTSKLTLGFGIGQFTRFAFDYLFELADAVNFFLDQIDDG